MKRKINIAVLMGGKSPEHEISLISGREVVKNLDPKKYNIFPVVVPRHGQDWILDSLPKRRIDIVFIAMHGPYGEDGTIQGMLELAGLKYTGSRVLASAIGMDKVMFRKLMKSEGIPIPKFVIVEKKNNSSPKNVIKSLGKPPYVVKPHNQGSSVGTLIIRRSNDLKKGLEFAFKYSDIVLVDEYLDGTEITCAVLGNNEPMPLPVIEIVPKRGEFFDYDSKYLEGGSDEIVPARISEKIKRNVQNMAIQVHKIVGCRGFSRVDFILKNGKQPFVLETNTIPGLTSMSLFPKAAMAAGISYRKLIDKIIYNAIK